MICEACRIAADQPDYTLHNFCWDCDCQHMPLGSRIEKKDKKDVTQD